MSEDVLPVIPADPYRQPAHAVALKWLRTKETVAQASTS